MSASGGHFNGLTPVEAELLALLSEECGELVQIIGKIQRHGLESRHPRSGILNREDLATEMGDVRAAMIMMCRALIVEKMTIHAAADDKLDRVGEYLHHAQKYAGSANDETAQPAASSTRTVPAWLQARIDHGGAGTETFDGKPIFYSLDAEDARRYRWLKSHIAVTIIERINPTQIDKRVEALDALIDLKIERAVPPAMPEMPNG